MLHNTYLRLIILNRSSNPYISILCLRNPGDADMIASVQTYSSHRAIVLRI